MQPPYFAGLTLTFVVIDGSGRYALHVPATPEFMNAPNFKVFTRENIVRIKMLARLDLPIAAQIESAAMGHT